MSRILLNGNILWIEKESDIREMVTTILTRHGAVVYPYPSLDVALKKFSSEAIDVILTDNNIHPGTGVKVNALMKKGDPSIPVILISGLADMKDGDIMCGKDVFAVLPKPFKVSQLLETVKRGIQHKSKFVEDDGRE